MLHNHRISIAYVQETKWVWAKALDVDVYKHWCSGYGRVTSGVGITIDLIDQVAEVNRKSEHIILIKLFWVRDVSRG